MSEPTTRSTLLEQLSNDMAGAVETAGASAVRVNARRRLPATGIVWSHADGSSIVVTASHVVERDEDITVTTADGRELPATLIGRDHRSDLAALRIDGETLPVANRVTADDIRVGAIALAIGHAGDLSATVGVVSAAGGPWHMGRGRRFETLISTDAPMFPGFSGGPLVDASGAVLGLLSSHLGQDQSLAIPADEIDRITEALRQHGRVRRGYLGVSAQSVPLPEALRGAHGLAQERALLVMGVEDGGPAAQAGIGIGDIVLAIGEREITGLDDLRGALGESVGQQTSVRVLRGGQGQTINVTIGEQIDEESGAAEHHGNGNRSGANGHGQGQRRGFRGPGRPR